MDKNVVYVRDRDKSHLVSAPKPARPVASLVGKGFNVLSDCIAIVRLAEGGYAVGLQKRYRSAGDGAVWKALKAARARAAVLAQLHRLPVIESI